MYPPMHYRLRSFKGVPFRLANFDSHFQKKCHFHFLIANSASQNSSSIFRFRLLSVVRHNCDMKLFSTL